MSRHLAAQAYGLAGAVVVADQAAKAWILHQGVLLAGGSREVVGPLRLTLVANRGISFGLLQGDAGTGRLVLILFSLAVAIALALWVRRANRRLTAAGVGLIVGGAIGNVIDRVRIGQVVDFIDVQRLGFPWVFNIADSAINVGVALLLLESLLTPKLAPSAGGSGEGAGNEVSGSPRGGR